MTTVINNNHRVFLIQGTGWNTQKYFCNMEDIVKCAKQFEAHQPYRISHFWNYGLKRLSVKQVIALLEVNQLDATFFKKTKKATA
jgi:hypothetical protein